MKKVFILLFVILIVNIGVAQKVRFGLQFSPIVSWMKPNVTTIESEKPSFGFNYGIVLDNNFTDHYSFSTGVLINNYGGKLRYIDKIPEFITADSTYLNLDSGAIVTYKLQFIEIPISMKFKTNEIGYITYFMRAGLNPQIKVGAKGDVTQENISGANIKKEVNFLNLSYHIGGGIEYSLGENTAFLVEVIYSNGFLDVTSDKNKVVLNNVALRLGILF